MSRNFFEVVPLKTREKLLVFSSTRFSFLLTLKEKLINLGLEVYFTSLTKAINENFDYFIFINPKVDFVKSFLKQLKSTRKRVFVLTNEKTLFNKFTKATDNFYNIKIVFTPSLRLSDHQLDQILWFYFSFSKERHLKLISLPFESSASIDQKKELLIQDQKKNYFKPTARTIFILIFFVLLFSHLLFIFPLFLSYWNLFYSIKVRGAYQDLVDSQWLYRQKSTLSLAKNLYYPVRKTYLFFAIAPIIDNLISFIDLTNKGGFLGKRLISLSKEQVVLLTTSFDPRETDLIKNNFYLIQKDIKEILNLIDDIESKIPRFFDDSIKKRVFDLKENVEKFSQFLSQIEKIIGGNQEKSYLIFFANNRELRPGGGFLGSFAKIDFSHWQMKNLVVYDVYDADGQLKIHVEPPYPIKKYLDQPHWYLRDSNFSPDFPENYQKAKFFLKEEMGWENFAGGILLTATAVEEIIDSFGSIYLPDFDEIVNKENFYIKAQQYSEKDFFPGSIQKKSFLSAVVRSLIINLEKVSPILLAKSVKKGFDEKQIVVYFEDSTVQKLFDQWHYSGRVVESNCLWSNNSCVNDYIFFYDANLGVNKSNYFLQKLVTLRTYIDTGGQINHQLVLEFKNQSPGEVFPGGVYRNYFQILLPNFAQVKQVTKDGVLIDKLDEEAIGEKYKRLGTFFEVHPGRKVIIVFDYYLNKNLTPPEDFYQLVVQKQIGSGNIDFIWEISFPSNIFLINQNFTPLVKDGSIIYNTILNTDKIFFGQFKFLNKN